MSGAPDLEAELWAAMRRVRHPRVTSMLGPLGLSPKIATIVGLSFGVERFGPGRLYYQPMEGGEIALIVGVVELGDLADLCAIDLETQQISLRLGIGKALGLNAINDVRFHGGVLRLVDRPLDWLREPVGSAFIIDWRIAGFTLADLDRPVTTLADKPIEVRCSMTLAERVERAFRRPLAHPNLRGAA
jgi:hypothetical protein